MATYLSREQPDMTCEDLISLADAETAEGDRLDGRGKYLDAALAHERAAALWEHAGSYVMPNACLVDAQNCRRRHDFERWYRTLPGAPQ